MRQLLKSALGRFSSPGVHRAIGDRHATVIAVAAQKGGVGKTTTAVSLAAALARFEDKRVLLVDLDPQGHVTTAMQSQVQAGGGLLSAVFGDENGEKEIIDIVTHTTVPGLDVTPFDAQLGRFEELLGARIGKEFILRDALKVTRTHYDVIVIDCPPNLGALTLNALVAADRVLVPCEPSPLALNGVSALVQSIGNVARRLNPEIDLLGVVLTRVDGRNTQLNEAIRKELDQDLAGAVCPVRIGTCTSLAKAQQKGVDIFSFDDGSRAATQYKELAAWVAQAV